MTREMALFANCAATGFVFTPVALLLVLTGLFPEGAPKSWSPGLSLFGVVLSQLIGLLLSYPIYMRLADWLEERGWRSDETQTFSQFFWYILLWVVLAVSATFISVSLMHDLFDFSG